MAADDNSLELWLDGCLRSAASHGRHEPWAILHLLVSCAGAALDVIAMLVGRTARNR